MNGDLLVPPHSSDAEQCVLGGLLLDSGAFDRIDGLRENDFYHAAHRKIFGALRALIERGERADTLLVAEELTRRSELENVGGIAYIGGLATNTPSALNVRRYAEIVRGKAMLREVLRHSIDLQGKAYEPGTDARELVQEAETRFMGILDARLEHAESVSMAQAVFAAVDARDAPDNRIATGFADLDRLLRGGMKPGDLVVIAGRPSMGKTALAICIAEHVAKSATVALFTLESSAIAVAERSLGYHESNTSLSEAIKHLHGLRIWIDEAAGIGLAYLRLRLRRIKRRAGLGLVIVDYLQLMRAKAENRTQEISEISRGLKAIAKEFGVPVIAVAQLSRAPEARTDKRPMLSDLRESGQIEQDADVIAMVYRDEYYDASSAHAGLAEIAVKKHRDGPTGTVFLEFDAAHTRFHHHAGDVPKAPEPQRRRATGTVTAPDFKQRAAGES